MQREFSPIKIFKADLEPSDSERWDSRKPGNTEMIFILLLQNKTSHLEEKNY